MTVPSTSDLSVRDVRAADLAVFFEWQRDAEANRLAAFPARDRDAFMAHWTTKVLGDDAVTKKTVVFEGPTAGNVLTFTQSGRRLVGYWFGREFWGRGVATRGLLAFLPHEPARPLYAHVAKHNVGSIRVLEKCGFTISDEHAESAPPPDDGVEEVVLELARRIVSIGHR